MSDPGFTGKSPDPNPDATYEVTGTGEQVVPPTIKVHEDRSAPYDPLYVALEVFIGGAQSHGADETVTLDWGDGSSVVTMPADTAMVDGHTYPAEGDYTITVTRTQTSTGAAAPATEHVSVPLS